MLQAIREKAQGWIAYAIVGFISIPFALWGVNQYFDGGGELNVITINDRDVTQREFRQAYSDQRRNLQQLMGENYRPELIDEDRVREQVIDNLVENELLITSADNRGFRISDAQVAQVIQSESSFQRDGRFERTLFEQYLRSQGESADSFGYRLKSIMLRNQMQGGIAGSDFVAPKALNRLENLRSQKREIEYVVIPKDQFAEGKPSDSEIAAYYEENKPRFLTAEQVRVEYLELKLADIAATMTPDETVLRQRYEEQKTRFGTPEDRQVAHILVTVDDETNEEQAKAKAESLRKRILGGERFEDLAKKESQDPGSADQGGDLGFIGHGIVDAELEKAAYAMGLSDVSEPVRSAFGYHILVVNAVKPGSIKSFETVKEQLKKEMQREMAESQFFEQAEQLATAAYENPETLSVAAERLAVKVAQSDWFSREGGDGIARNPRVIAAAFSDDVLNRKNNSEPLELSAEHYVVVRILEHKPSRQQTLDEVRDQIISSMSVDMAKQRARDKGRALAQQLKDGARLVELAAAEGLELKKPAPVSRTDGEIAAELRGLVFQLAAPDAGTVSVGGVSLGNGDYAVVALTGVATDVAKESETAAALKDAVLQARGQSAVRATIESMRAKAKIRVNRENF